MRLRPLSLRYHPRYAARYSIRKCSSLRVLGLTRILPRPSRGELPGGLMPVVDPRFLVTPQHARDLLRDRLGTRTRVAEQPREDLPRLGDRDRRGFPPRLAVSPGTGTTAPRATI